ncbi:aspartate aminotransferase [Natronocella acetinitrilica]|uniref:Aminotransferase n=1 Tax=Natronocella acetinitrilica TaxID=414046 RepID=A0AAE3KG47_9GAMM|nr:pyridoxal phosphate-dependent aminotransferase [Natronocella acetinitrilica]MCP1674812.1 aspartate aminotransferase [Natronocella acetinitrilica]
MDSPLSKRVQRVKPSPTIAVTARAAEMRAAGKDIIGLSAGEPDFDTPAHIKQAGIDAIRAGHTKYTAVDGTPDLKQAIIAKLRRDNDLDYTAREILVSAGAKHSIYNLMAAVLDDGDEVVIPAPYWVSYPDMTKLFDAVPVIVETHQHNRFKMTPDQLDAALTDRSKLLMINSPCNPTGTVYTKADLLALGEVLQAYPRVLVMTDDIYEHIIWADEPFSNLVNACPSLRDRTMVVNGVSKGYAMTGWRIGYAAGPEAIISAMKKVQSQSTSNPCTIAQTAATAALQGDQSCIGPMREAYRERHDYVVAALNAMPGVDALAGLGTFYSFPNVEGAIRKLGLADDVALAEYLINEAQVALVPGSAFGMGGHLRVSFATSMCTLEKAMQRLHAALA